MARRFAAVAIAVLFGLVATTVLAQDRPSPAPAPGGPAKAAPGPAPSGPPVQDGSTVRLEYTLTLDRGEVVDSNRGRDPLVLTQGRGEIIAGLESALDGMRAGESKRVTVKPEDGYGPVDPTAEMEVAKDRVPADVAVGSRLAARSESGQVQVVRVKEIKPDTVVLDLNHPLAGKTLHFDIKVLDVKAPGANAAPGDTKAPGGKPAK